MNIALESEIMLEKEGVPLLSPYPLKSATNNPASALV
jgi:hypothetical protein